MGRTLQTKRKRSSTPATAGKAKLYKKAASTMAVAKRQFTRVNSQTAGFLGIEKKFYDTGVSAGAISVTADCSAAEKDPATVDCISAPAQGDGPNEREGKRIVIKSVQIRGVIDHAPQSAQTSLDAHSAVHVALVLDTQSNGAQLNSEDVFVNPSTGAAGLAQPMRNLYYGKRFRVLKAQTFMTPIPNAAAYSSALEVSGAKTTFDWYVPLGEGIVANFTSGTTAGIANVMDNSLHVIAFQTNNQNTITYNSRIRFVG